jgi:hypothetical protein
MLDIRESAHSSRLLDVAGRLNPDIHRLQVGLGHSLHARGLPATTANLGSYEIFHGLVTKQTLTLAYIDIFWRFQLLALAGIVLVLVLWPNARRAASTVVRRVCRSGFRRRPAFSCSRVISMKRRHPSGVYSSATARGQFNGNSRIDGNFSAALARVAGPMAEASVVCSRVVPDKRGSGKAGVLSVVAVA